MRNRAVKITPMPTQSDVHDGRNNVMCGCKGDTYAEKKVELLRQLGYYVTVSVFKGLTENEIDRKARTIMFS